MDTDENYIENIRETILRNKHPSFQTTDKKEIRVVCPYCDSAKHKDPAKMYISMTPPFKFHCFRCETSGVLNQQTLRDLEIFDTNIGMSLASANKNYKQTQGVQYISYRGKTLKNIPVNTEASAAAVSYFNSRYGTDYTNEEITSKFKCVTDAAEFFKNNNIHTPKMPFDFSKAIGFISSDSSHIIFRDISGYQKSRYTNLNISKNDNASKIYNISADIDIMKEKINLVITEGIFDIIGVYNHFYKGTDKEKNTVFAAACGKGYTTVILNYIRMGFLDMDITIYSDGDVDLNFYKSLKMSSPYLKNLTITIFYNNFYDPATGYGKDYGVKKEDIQLRKVII